MRATRDSRCPWSGAGRGERGAAAVEMALVMPLLILMVMGIIDFGRIFNGEIQLSQAAREGARVAALGTSGYTVDDVITRARTALTSPAFQGTPSSTDFKSCSLPTTSLPTTCITIAVVTPSATAPPTFFRSGVCQSGDETKYYGQVTVTIPYNKILWGPTSLSQTAVMKCSG